jgi:hypothetical protein
MSLFLDKEQKIPGNPEIPEVFSARKGLISDNRIPSWSYKISQSNQKLIVMLHMQNAKLPVYIAQIKTYHFAS